MNVEFSSLNTDYSDDTQEAVTLDSWGGQTLNIRAYLTDLELVDDSAIATKIIDANDSNLWTGVKVTKHDFQMVMTFDAAIDAALENIDSTNTVVVDTIEIYNNTGTRAAPVYDQKIAEQTGGSVKYFEYINNFGLLDPTTSSATAEAQVQEGSMFSLVAVSESVFDLDTINTKILPDFLYPDQDVGDNTVVDRVEVYRFDPVDGNVEQLVATLQSDDEMLVSELDTYAVQVFG
jgi:hypothetical protein